MLLAQNAAVAKTTGGHNAPTSAVAIISGHTRGATLDKSQQRSVCEM